MSVDTQTQVKNAASQLSVGYVSFGRATFDIEAANQLSAESREVLKRQPNQWHFIDSLVVDPQSAEAAAQQLSGKIDVLLCQFTTFVDARYIDILASELKVPCILWAIREPNQKFGERLSLNSLTGANAAGQRLRNMGIPFRLVYGNADEPSFEDSLQVALRFWAAWRKLQQFHVITLGDAPEGFFFSQPSASVCRQLGIDITHLDLNDTFQRAASVSETVSDVEIEQIKQQVRAIEHLPPESVKKFAQMISVLKAELHQLKADAVAVRCWPEFFTEFGAAACSTISALTDTGIMGSCEADVLGSLSMDVLYQLTGSPAYLGDLVEVREEEGAVVFWHCGAGAFSLARSDTGAVAGKHPNREIGFTLEFGLKPGRISLLRIGEDQGGQVRALIGSGEVLDVPQRFRGTSACVRLDGDADVAKRVVNVMEAGFEPHYAFAYGDAVEELARVLTLMKIPVTRF